MSWHRLPPGHAGSMWRNPGRCIGKNDPSISPTHPGFEGTELLLWRYRVRGTGTVWFNSRLYGSVSKAVTVASASKQQLTYLRISFVTP